MLFLISDIPYDHRNVRLAYPNPAIDKVSRLRHSKTTLTQGSCPGLTSHCASGAGIRIITGLSARSFIALQQVGQLISRLRRSDRRQGENDLA
jgi:hypothetical protein